MTWKEFRQWVTETYGYQFEPHLVGGGTGAEWRAIWGRDPDRPLSAARAGTGTGYPANYTVAHQRRFATWVRVRELVAPNQIQRWLDLAEHHDAGWLVGSQGDVKWIKEPAMVAERLLADGFIAVPCGLQPQ